MSRLNVGNLYNENEDGAPVVSGISTFSSPHYFVPPSGTTAQRPQNPGEGMIRFNTDSGHLEYYTGTHWADVITNNNELGDQNQTNSAGGTGTRAVYGGGGPAPATTTIDYFTVSTLGNAVAWGAAITQSRTTLAGFASRTRGCWAGGTIGVGPYYNDTIDFVTIASTGSCTDFGNLTTARTNGDSAVSNETRGCVGGGGVPAGASDIIDYVTIASTGNAVDFGNLSEARNDPGGAFSSSVRGIFTGGYTSGPAVYYNTIDYITISTTGNAQDFGDLTDKVSRSGGLSNSTRGVVGGGRNASDNPINTINFTTIATTGNAQDFGNLATGVSFTAGTSSPTRGVWAGGYQSPGGTHSDVIQYVEIASTGNAVDFGDLSDARGALGGFSNGHGGL